MCEDEGIEDECLGQGRLNQRDERHGNRGLYYYGVRVKKERIGSSVKQTSAE